MIEKILDQLDELQCETSKNFLDYCLNNSDRIEVQAENYAKYNGAIKAFESTRKMIQEVVYECSKEKTIKKIHNTKRNLQTITEA